MKISRISGDSRKFPAREYYHCEIFLSRNSRRRDFAKFSCRENFLFYSKWCVTLRKTLCNSINNIYDNLVHDIRLWCHESSCMSWHIGARNQMASGNQFYNIMMIRSDGLSFQKHPFLVFYISVISNRLQMVWPYLFRVEKIFQNPSMAARVSVHLCEGREYWTVKQTGSIVCTSCAPLKWDSWRMVIVMPHWIKYGLSQSIVFQSGSSGFTAKISSDISGNSTRKPAIKLQSGN